MFRFYSNPSSKRRITVVGKVVDDYLHLATSCCSHKDQFVRKIGRGIAEGRLKKGKLFASIKVKDKIGVSEFVKIAKNICAEVHETKEVIGPDFKANNVEEREIPGILA